MPFPTLAIPEVELGWMNETQRHEHVMDQLKHSGLYDPTALYCGIDANDLLAQGGFGGRTETWAVDEMQFKSSAEEMDKYGDGKLGGSHNPLYYALTAGDLPALAVYKRDAFTNLGPGVERDENEWTLKPGETMDQATMAVVYLF